MTHDDVLLMALSATYLPPNPISAGLPPEGTDALWYMDGGIGWDRGELVMVLLMHGDPARPFVLERDGARYPVTCYSHWMPLPPDPAD